EVLFRKAPEPRVFYRLNLGIDPLLQALSHRTHLKEGNFSLPCSTSCPMRMEVVAGGDSLTVSPRGVGCILFPVEGCKSRLTSRSDAITCSPNCTNIQIILMAICKSHK